VSDPSVAATAVAIAAAEGAQANVNVATFTDPGGVESTADYSATILWGDGNTSPGAISVSNGVFTVSGTNTYAEEGAYTATVTIAHDAAASVVVKPQATVSDAALHATAAAINATQGSNFNQTVATLTDDDPAGTNTDYTATIDWGDKTALTTVTGANITESNNVFSVPSGHDYASPATYTLTVVISDAGGATTTLTETATVAAASLAATASPVSATEGNTFSGNVATFTDADLNAKPSVYSATILWGDGNTSPGNVSGPDTNGVFTVSGTDTYTEEGNYTLSVVINDTADGASATVAPVATVTDPSVAATAVAIAATEGASANVNVATFTDPGGAESTAGYSATILWGDGNTSPGAISVSDGVFTVSGTNTYAEEGTFTATVTIAHDAAAAVVVKPQATVSDPSVAATAVAIAAAEGAQANVNVATFTDPGGAESTAGYSATILWGDGNTSPGAISVSDGVFTVSGTNTYAEEGTYTATVTIAHDSAASVIVKPVVTVSDAALSATGSNVTTTEGHTVSWTAATFTDADPAGTAGDYTATIDWGDNTAMTTITGAQLTGSGPGAPGFGVPAIHDYAEEGSFTLTVVISDAGGATTTVKPVATVNDAALSATATNVTATEGTTFGATVATFTDGDPGGTASDYTATIDWGDGTTATAMPQITGSGTFGVPGSHVYAEEGTYTMSVVISDAAATATVHPVATVSDPSVSPSSVSISATAGTPATVTVATFTDPGGAEDALTDYSATIVWGDGHTSAGTIGGPDSSGVFTVSGTNTYADAGTFTASVTIKHDAALAATVSDTATVVSAGPTNVTSDVSVTRTGVRYDMFRHIFIQTITIKNTSGNTLTGPLALVLTNLSSDATLANESGTFNGNPYINLAAGMLPPGGSVSVVLSFKDPTLGQFSYGTQVWQNL